MKTRLLRVALGVLPAALAACSSDLTPRSVLTDLRVLAVEATPLEAGPSDVVTLEAELYVPAAVAVVAERWSFCPLSVGATSGYACAVPDCEEVLRDCDAGQVPCRTATVAPYDRVRACAARFLGSAAPASLPAQVPDVVDTLVRYVATTADGVVREAVVRVPLHVTGAPAARNHPPVVQLVSIGGVELGVTRPPPPPPAPIVLQRGAELEFRVVLTPESAEPYVAESGVATTEAPVVSFFTTDGRFDYDRGLAPDARVKLKYDHVASPGGTAQLWAVASDLRGGVAVVGPYEVQLAP